MLDLLEKGSFVVSDNIVFLVTISSVIATSIVAYYFFRFYRISGIGHFLGIPAGFAFLTAAHAFFAIELLIENTRFSNLVTWMWLIALSYSFSLIAMSYYYRSAEFNERTKLVRTMSYAAIPVLGLLLAIEVMSLEQRLISFKILDEYFTGFSLVALGYIIIQCVTAIKTGGNPKQYFIPVGFVLLWIAQLSMLSWAIFENANAMVLSVFTNLGAPILFIYALRSALRRDKIAKTTKT